MTSHTRNLFLFGGMVCLLLVSFGCGGGTAEETTVRVSADELGVSLPT